MGVARGGSPPLADDHPRPGPVDTAALQYTGGTTGVPKGAILTHRNLRANAAQGRAWVPGLADGEEVVYAVLPLFHAYGLTLCLTFAMSIGATLVLFPRFDVEQVLDAQRRRPATFLPGVPPIYGALADAAAARQVSLRTIRYGLSGAMALPVAVVDRWEAATGGLLVEGYGMTETSPISVGNPVSARRRPGTVACPSPPRTSGSSTPTIPAATASRASRASCSSGDHRCSPGTGDARRRRATTLLDDGWVRTGDIVSMDREGFVTVVDRIKELIITGGFNVYPSEVEDALRLLPGVRDAVAVGLPDGSGGEQVVAAVLAEEGRLLDPEETRSAVRSHLAGYKVPRRIVVVDDLPHSIIGKVLRREVRDRLLRHTGDG